jgi:hypothetical protein
VTYFGQVVVFSGSSGFSTNKTDHHDITEILLKVALNTIKQTTKQTNRLQTVIVDGENRLIPFEGWYPRINHAMVRQ